MNPGITTSGVRPLLAAALRFAALPFSILAFASAPAAHAAGPSAEALARGASFEAPSISPDGQSLLYIARDSESADWRTLLRFELFDTAHFSPLGFADVPNRLPVASDHRGRDAIWEMDLRDQKDLELVFSRPDVDVDGAYEFPGTERVVGFSYETDKPQLHVFDGPTAGLQATIDKALPGAINSMVDGSSDGQRIVVLSTSDTQGGLGKLLDLEKKTLRPLAIRYESLQGATLSPMRPVQVPGPGGISMPGYLTLPAGRAAMLHSTGTEDLESQSPRRRAAEIKAPVLLVHGHADVNVVADHSEKMAGALKRAGKPHELLVISNGDHSLRTPVMRQTLYERLVAFLAANLDEPRGAKRPLSAPQARPNRSSGSLR